MFAKLFQGSQKPAAGAVRLSSGAMQVLRVIDVEMALALHARGDRDAANQGGPAAGVRRLVPSVYRSIDGEEFWVVTDGERRVTSVLLPDEY